MPHHPPADTDRTLTSRDIAELAGVSQTTVSRVLRNSAAVQPETRKLVLDVIATAGYQPSAAARSMRTRRSNTVALVISNLAVNPLYPALLQLLFTSLQKVGLIATVWETEEFDQQIVNALLESSVDGFIVATAVETAAPFLRQLNSRRPLVLMHRSIGAEDFDQFSSDNAAGAQSVANFFVQAGKKRPGLIAAVSDASTIQTRESSYRATLEQLGLGLEDAVCARVPEFSYDAGFEAAKALLSKSSVDCLFCVNDIVAIGAVDGARNLGVKVPEDLWIVGYDDIPMCSWKSFELSTVRQPLATLAHQAVLKLRDKLAGKKSLPEQFLFPNELIVRKTSI